MDIRGKAAIVTGGASGIGRATASRLAAAGAARITLVDVNEAGLTETADLVRAGGAEPVVMRLDLADLAATGAWVDRVVADGAPDILHNNAGVVSGAGAFPEMPLDRLRWIVDVNLTSLVLATQTIAQGMRARGGGVIVNTVSTVALGPGFRDAMYAVTKAGVMMLTRCCASLKEEWGVRVAGVLPGLTDTPILHTTGGDRAADWMAPVLANNERCAPGDIAAAVIDLIHDDALAGGDWVAVRKENGVVTRQWGHDTPL
ncbi:SDR family NAD(P)-dependent oxidoreductase [uncultured Sphingomonas sp.]|uniref:SDR family NAD(P)-dependent oxidoreductase n=1 Tax=uncultured Sphingomonas sp. TaxID=158754 RepID=UPI00261B54BB|nr:SDR family oxidoreductase [uncultured Sphingomonas sp.]